MATETTARPIEARLLDLFRHLGIERAHIAAGGPPPLLDWYNLAILHPERVASLTVISPPIQLSGGACRGDPAQRQWRRHQPVFAPRGGVPGKTGRVCRLHQPMLRSRSR
jgi:hypothetical protein